MRVLVTGASGFVGRHVVDLLRLNRVEFSACCRKSNEQHGNEYVYCDLLDYESVERLCRSVRATHLIHLAWDVSTSAYWMSPANMQWLRASQVLMDSFVENGGQRLIGVGTCAEYSHTQEKCDEAFTPTCPDTVYGRAKLACADYLHVHEGLGVSAAWARLFYLMGPREAPGRLIPSACDFLQGKRDFICKNGKAVLDYLDARDAARALVHLALSRMRGVVNIASGKGIAVRDLLHALALANGLSDRFVFEEDENALFTYRVAETHRLHEELGFVPRYSLYESLADCFH